MPLMGTFFWLAMRCGLFRFNQMVIDGPKPFAEDQCDLEELRDPVRSSLLAAMESAEKLGFHSPTYSVSNATGIETHGGAIRMLHDSGQCYLQIIGATSAGFYRGVEAISSATSSPLEILTTTNGPPSYNVPVGMTMQRLVGTPLATLLEKHQQLFGERENLMRFESMADVGAVIDHSSILFHADKVERGIFVEVRDDDPAV